MADWFIVMLVMGCLNLITTVHYYRVGWDEGEAAQLADDQQQFNDYRTEIEELEQKLQSTHADNQRLLETNATLRANRKRLSVVVRETYRLAQKLKTDKSELELQLESFVNAYDRTNSTKESKS